ncbi:MULTISPECIES: DUF397 domain-containing protein [unclassified Streptomyces]|uniref:DUF397 domain-containing protein n=1 Tax=unclassified Streptomyces TaxID=2593676 RepID=UPI00336A6F13
MPITPDLSTAAWRKSSYSNTQAGSCVEVVDGIPGIVPLPDSKNPEGPTLVFESATWTSFVQAVKRGEFHAA